MKLQTKFEETIEVNESDILNFELGLPGFEDEKQFVLLPMEETPFSVLQSVLTPNLAFVTVDPFVFFKNYDFELSNSDQQQLDVSAPGEVMVQVIVTIGEPFEKSTANLQAPVVINTKRNEAKQVILTDVNYRTRHSLKDITAIKKEG